MKLFPQSLSISTMLKRYFFSAITLLISTIGVSQPGKDGALTISTTNTVLNRYTRVTADVPLGSNSVTVFDINELSRDGIGYLPTGYNSNASSFASNSLATGDLILLFQAQGAQINNTNSINYGEVNNLNNAGKYELAYVQSVSGNTIYFDCKTRFSYFSSNYVQVIRVPQYTTLTVNNGASVVPVPWGSPFFGGADPSATTRRRGGFVSIIANSIVNNGSINANAAGFRGGTILNGSAPSGDGYYADFFYNVTMRGGEKGESIAGYRPDYDALGGRYGRGAPANGGGGGNSHNCGGGGGANGGNASGWFRGAGVMNDFGTCGSPGAWTLDPNYIANGNALTNSTGGGQGGYSYSANNVNACSNGPSYPIDFITTGSPSTNVLTTAWGGDQRKAFGGFGGRPLISPAIDRQIFFGGGGGAGDGNNDANNDGGDGGGIIFLIVDNAVTGTGAIQANGEGASTTRGNGNDSPGGGGGGTILVQSSSIASSITINANGGRGGSQNISFATEAEGPGGGGGGGAIYINASSDASTKTVNGGANGITNSPSLTEFIANGATSGNTGSISTTVVYINFNECLADLSITKTASNMSPVFGSNITFTLTVNNEGQNDATNVIVSDILNSGYTFVSATPSKGTFNNITGQWSVGNLVYPETATLQIIVTVKATGIYSNTATITSDNPDPVTTNNTSTVTPVPTNCTVGTPSSTPTLCINSTLTQITHSTTVATGIGTAVGLPTGLSATWASNQVRINGTPTQSGVFNYTIPLASTCGTLSAGGTITVNINSVAPTSTQTICRNVAMTSITRSTTGATGRGTASGLPPGVTSSWASNVLTISGTPTTNGTYNYSIPLTGGCGTVNATGTIIVTNSALTVSAASSSPTLCRNTSLTPITHTTTNATGIGTPIGLPTGVIAIWSSNTITISGSPTSTGAFNYSIPLIGACGPVNATGTIRVNGNTVSSASSTPTVCRNLAMTAVTHTTTGATGRGTVAGLPPGVTATWASNVLTISGTPTTVGTYVYTIPLTGGCVTEQAVGTITVVNASTVADASGGNNRTLCINTVLTTITRTTTGATGIGTATGLPTGVSASWSSNTLTISGTPTQSGTFNYSIPLTGGCNALNANGTITVNAANSVSAASSSPTLCISTAMTAITHSTTGATGRGTATGLPTGVTSSWTNNVLTISGTPTQSGTFNYSIPLTGGCVTTPATGTIVVTVNNTPGTVSSNPTLCINTALTAITRTTTGATGIGTPTGLPTGVTASWSANTLTVSGTPTQSGTFNYSIPLTGGCGTVNATGTIIVTIDNTVGNASGGNNRTVCINSAMTTISRTTTGATGIGTAIGLPTGVSAGWSGNTLTVSGTPTQSGTFNYSIPLTGGCGTVNATGTITVTAVNTVSAASSTPTVCRNVAMTLITHTTTGATGRGTATGLPPGLTSSWAANVLTISGTPTTAGTYNYSIPLTGGCGTVNATGTITVVTANVAGTASSNPTLCINTALTPITRTTGAATGIGTPTGLPTGVTAAWSANVITVSGTPTQSGTFNYSIPLTGGCGSINATGTITVSVNNTVGNASGGNNRTDCLNSNIAVISRTTTGATGIGTPTGLPTGVTASWSNDVITVSGTPTASGSFNYSIPLTGGCGSINATGTITVTAVNVGTITGGTTVCTGTNSTTLSLDGTFTGTSQWQSSLDNNTFNDIANETSTTYTAVNLTSTTYYRAMVTNGVCSSSTTAVETITVSSAGTPTININQQPNCTTATGEIQITSSPTGLTFSIDGSTYQSGTTFSSLNPGSYNITAKNSVGCISAPLNATINTQPLTPNAPTATNLSACVYNLPGSYVTDVNGFNSPYFKWYTTSTGDTTSASYIQRSTATSYQQLITATTTYYVSVVHPIGNCESARSTVINTVIDPLEAYIPFTNDYIWKGGAVADDNDWNTITNWYQWDGTKYITVNTVPGTNDNVYIPPTGTCTPAQPRIQNENTQQFINLIIKPGGTLTVEGNGVLNVSGNWENNGTFVSGNGIVNFLGAGNHIISGVSNTTFYDVNINKPMNGTSKSVLTLAQQIYITGKLNLNAGLFDITTYSIDMGNRSITGGSAASYVKTSSTGFLKRIVGENTSNNDGSHVRFPIGRSNYNPAHVDNSGTDDTFSLRVYDLVSDNADENGTMTTLPVVERTWLIEEETVGGSNVDLQLYWNGTLESRIEELNSFDYTTAYIAHFAENELAWENKGGNAPDGPGYAQQNGITSFSPFTISSEGGLGWSSPLPVELLDFTATCLDDESVQINWSTASENNSSHFEVRKSLDGYTWNTLETVSAAGNSTELLEYSVLDRSLTKGNAYYRLNQIDIDGKSELFDVVNTNCDEKINANLLTVYPNPSSTNFFVDFNSENIEGKGELTIVDARGIIVYSKNVLVETGSNFYMIDEIKVQPGIYYVKLTGENFSTKVVKQTIN